MIILGAVLIVLAYSGVTFGLGPADKATVVTAVLTFDALVFGAVATLVALSAYRESVGHPELDIEMWFNFCEVNKPHFKVGDPPEGSYIPIEQFKQNQAKVTLRNTSEFEARNASVLIKLVGISVMEEVPKWDAPFTHMTGYIDFLWESADRLVHRKSERRLPDFVLGNASILPDTEPKIEISVYADRMPPVHLTLPVTTYRTGTPGRPETQS